MSNFHQGPLWTSKTIFSHQEEGPSPAQSFFLCLVVRLWVSVLEIISTTSDLDSFLSVVRWNLSPSSPWMLKLGAVDRWMRILSYRNVCSVLQKNAGAVSAVGGWLWRSTFSMCHLIQYMGWQNHFFVFVFWGLETPPTPKKQGGGVEGFWHAKA